MGVYFGTDGLRGKANEDLTFNLVYKVGNALTALKVNPKIIIGSDTRVSNSYFTIAIAGGAMSGGAEVIDLGIVPTAGVAYITKKLKADYGVVVSASHNGAEYNGIKIFSSKGYKIGDKEEERLERAFIHENVNDFPNIGTYRQNFNAVKLYKEFLIGIAEKALGKRGLKGKTIVLDCANGAAYKIAPEVFKKLGAKVIATSASKDGLKINDSCGALHPENLSKKVLKYKADMGFAFDGDSDRLIPVDENGNVLSGDQIIYGIAIYMKNRGLLKKNAVVGTRHTNVAIEKALAENKIELIRTDIGDKYVLEKLVENDLSIGGEQSGHIIFKDVHTTGDGILSAIEAAIVAVKENKKFSDLFNVKIYPQTNVDVVVDDKLRVINSEELDEAIADFNEKFKNSGRIMIRASGTEPKIRIMVESENESANKKIAADFINLIKRIK